MRALRPVVICSYLKYEHTGSIFFGDSLAMLFHTLDEAFNRILDILNGLIVCIALTIAAGQTRHFDNIAAFFSRGS